MAGFADPRFRERLRALAGRGALRETPSSWIVLRDRDAWKLRKPLALGFVDLTALERREEACRDELRGNRRLAAGVYRSVERLTDDGDGTLRIGGSGPVRDWLVRMRRLPDDERGDVLLARGLLGDAEMRRLAVHLAGFHQGSRREVAADRFGTAEALARNLDEVCAPLHGHLRGYVATAALEEIDAWQRGFLEEHAHQLRERARSGAVRACHGDLQLEHVYLAEDGGITVVDRNHWGDRFRFVDVCADVAFLCCDVSEKGRVDLSERLFAAYAEVSNDYGLYPLLDFYESYQSHIRAVFAALLADDPGADAAVREGAAREARRYAMLALASARRSLLRPAVVAMGGLIASGKSTLAEAIAGAMSATRVVADSTRDFLAGPRPEDPWSDPDWLGAYAPEFTDTLYDELIRRAAAVLEAGRPVVIDGCFGSEGTRARARELARRFGVPFTYVECRVDPEIVRERLRGRARETGASESGWLEIFEDFRTRWRPAEELPDSQCVVVDTSRPPAENVEHLAQRLPVWPRGLTE